MSYSTDLIIVKNKLFGSRSGYDPDSRKKGKISFFDELNELEALH
jgi:hypothetical protein